MSRKEIGTQWDRDNRNAINENFKNLFHEFTNVVEVVSEKAYGDVIDAAKLNWQEPVSSQSNLPSEAEEGDTRFVRDTGKVFRFNGEEWNEIQQIDATPINEVERRFNDNLNSVNQQLAQKPNKGEISLSDLDKNRFQIDETWVADSLKQQITGSAPVNTTPPREGVVHSKLADKSVTARNVEFVKQKSNNLYNVEKVVQGYYANATGSLVQDSNFNYFEFYSKPNQAYSFDRISRWVAYDESFNFIATGTSSPFTTPEGTFFMRLNIASSNLVTAQLNEGATLLPYDEFRSELNSDEGLDILPSVLTVYDEHLTEDAVTPQTIKVFKKSKNLFNKRRVMPNVTINGDGEEIHTSTSAITIDYIRIKPDTTYSKSLNSALVIGFYTKKKKFISRSVLNSDVRNFTSPGNAYYMRVAPQMTNMDGFMLNEGEDLLPFEEFNFELETTDEFPITMSEKLTQKVAEEAVEKANEGLEQFKEEFETSTNILNLKDLSYGHINAVGDVVEGDEEGVWRYLAEDDFIRTTKDSYSVKGISRVNLYDESKKNRIDTFSLSSTEGYVIDTSEASYMSVNLSIYYLDQAQINEGEILHDYEPFYIRAKEQPRKYPVVPKEIYSSEPLEGKSTADEEPLDDYTYTDIYGLYDDLMTEHPTYPTRILVKNDSEDRPIYSYRFTPEAVDNASTNEPNNILPKFFITTGTHGAEKAAIWTTYMAMKKITEEWHTNPILEILRFNVDITIMPIVNPYSFEHSTRTNINNVDPLRNFPNSFERGDPDPSSSYYRGTAPLSEIETQAVWEMFLEDSWDYVMDFHNFGGGEYNDYNFLWVPGQDTFTQTLAQRYIRKMSNKFKREYSYFPQEVEKTIGYSNMNRFGVYNEAFLRGIPAHLFEIGARIPIDPDNAPFNSDVVTMGTEAVINWLYMCYLNFVEEA